MKNLSLIQATNNDWKILATLEKKAAGETFHALIDEREIREYIKNSEVFFIILDGEKIGTISYENKGSDHVHFNGLTVIRKHRRKGIASWAVRNILDNISNNRIIDLVVHPKNTPAILVYLKAGFVIEDWKDNFFGDGEPRLSLIKK